MGAPLEFWVKPHPKYSNLSCWGLNCVPERDASFQVMNLPCCREPGLETLFEALLSVIQGRDPCFLILDALDESERDVMAMLSQIVSRGLKNLHILVTSRKESDIESILAPIVTGKLSLSQDGTEVDADIGVYVRHCLVTDSKLKKWSDSVRKDTETSLIDGAHGMYVESSSPSWYIDLHPI